MTPQEFLVLLSSILMGTGGQFFLKLGALRLGEANATNFVSHILRIALTPELVIGLTLYGVAAIAYILILTRVNLSVVGPSVALSYVFSVLLGYFVFQEALPLARLLGLGFITLGVILVISPR